MQSATSEASIRNFGLKSKQSESIVAMCLKTELTLDFVLELVLVLSIFSIFTS